MNFGVQTFTVRRAQKKSIEDAYLPLVRMGILDLEIARMDFNSKNAAMIKSLSDKHGIRPVAIQVKPKHVFEDLDGVVEFCKTVGCKNVVISMLPFKCILGNDDEFYSFVSKLDDMYAVYEKHGITLAYHHHNWEYIKLSSGKTRMEVLISGTEKIKFVHDTYWTARSGIDPKNQIRAFGDRLLGIHLRDLTFHKKLLQVIPRDTFVGDGVIDFKRVLSVAEEVGCEYFVIEQKTKTPYEDIERSLANLKNLRSTLYEK